MTVLLKRVPEVLAGVAEKRRDNLHMEPDVYSTGKRVLEMLASEETICSYHPAQPT
jgi:hypothetical protein